MEVDEEQQKIKIQIAGKIGCAQAIMRYELVPWDSPQVRHSKTQDKQPEVLDGKYCDLGCNSYCDVNISKTPFKGKHSKQLLWWPAQIESVDSDGNYRVRCDTPEQIQQREGPRHQKKSLEDTFKQREILGRKAARQSKTDKDASEDAMVVDGLSIQDIRIVCCKEDCRQHNLMLSLPQLWCCTPGCAYPLREPGNTWYKEIEDKNGPKTPLHFCDKCYKKLSKTSVQEHKQTQIRLQRLEEINMENFREIKIPKQPGYRPGEPVALPEGTPGEDVGESAQFVRCNECKRWFHWVCAMYNDKLMQLDWKCKECQVNFKPIDDKYRCKNLLQTDLGKHIEHGINQKFKKLGVVHSPIIVRVLSALKCKLLTPESLRSRWSNDVEIKGYPTHLEYMSKFIMLFQEREDGCDVCLFAMYVQEYGLECPPPNTGRCYISYLDSIKYFECLDSKNPEAHHRSTLYHEFMCSYLGYIRQFGFQHVHIWVEPPKNFDEYIFFDRPKQDKKPMERAALYRWYTKMLDKAKEAKIVDRYCNIYEEYNDIKSVREIPIFKGDQWETTLNELVSNLGMQRKAGGDNTLSLQRQESASLLKQAKKSMHSFNDQFLVVTLKPADKAKKKDRDPIISYHSTNKREDFLDLCVKNHWQFESLQYAKWSTMMICYQLVTSPKPDQCKADCTKGRIDDGHGMIGCDNCDKWFHYECVGIPESQACAMDSYFCEECEFQRHADEGSFDNLDFF